MKRMFLPVGALTLALLLGVGAMMARAREPRLDAASPVSLGSVDMEQVYNASGAIADLDQAARRHEAEGASRIKKIMAVPYLEQNELEEYGTLIGKEKMTPEEEKRAGELKAVSEKRADEQKMLDTKGNLTDADKSRIKHLEDLKQTLQEQVRPGLIADFRAQQEGWIGAYRHQQMIQLRDEVGKIAKEKGIAHVFDTNSLVYSVNDLTPVVLQRLNKKSRK